MSLLEAVDVGEGLGHPKQVAQPARRSPEGALRAFDITLTLLLLPFALVLSGLVAALILLDSPGGVLFRQVRVGRDGHHFEMLKFRKMRHAATGGPLTVADDERFTPIGRLLTLTKLDELPQLWNVLRGDMRLVGPRPEVPEFVAQYRDSYDPILTVRPGITGPAAVEFASEGHLLAAQTDPRRFYEEHLMPRKISIDIAYVQNRTHLGDLRILAATVLVPLFRIASRLWGGRHGHALVLGSGLLLALAVLAANGGT